MTSHGEAGPAVAAPGASAPTLAARPASTLHWILTNLEELATALLLATMIGSVGPAGCRREDQP